MCKYFLDLAKIHVKFYCHIARGAPGKSLQRFGGEAFFFLSWPIRRLAS
jgi:hypothetical protein